MTLVWNLLLCENGRENDDKNLAKIAETVVKVPTDADKSKQSCHSNIFLPSSIYNILKIVLLLHRLKDKETIRGVAQPG